MVVLQLAEWFLDFILTLASKHIVNKKVLACYSRRLEVELTQETQALATPPVT